jgi:hypothetical protein
MAWVEFQKVFNGVPHSRIIKSIELIGISNKIISFTKKAMSYWTTSMRLHTDRKTKETEDVGIQRGIFQGNSSPLLFCISLIPSQSSLSSQIPDTKNIQQKQKYHIYFIWII